MASINLIDSFQEFKDAENIDRPTLMKVMEDVFKTLIRKKNTVATNVSTLLLMIKKAIWKFSVAVPLLMMMTCITPLLKLSIKMPLR